MTLVTVWSHFGVQEKKNSHASTFSPSIHHVVMGLDAMISLFLMLNFKSDFSLFSSTLIKNLFSSSSLFAIRMVSSVYPRLLIFSQQSWFQLVIHPASAFYMISSVYRLNKQGDNIQPWRTLFPIWNQLIFPRPVPTVASWPVYKFLRRQVRWSGIPISWRIFHSLLWSTHSKALGWSIKQK